MVNHSNPSLASIHFFKFSKVLKLAALLSFVIISFGSLVRASSAGLACPDWPLCFGQLVPSFDYQIFLEWFHRLLAGGLGVLILYALSLILRSSYLRKALGLQLAVAVVLLSIQIVLGGLTVLKLLDAKTVGAHLINAILFYSVIVWMMLRARQIGERLSGISSQITVTQPFDFKGLSFLRKMVSVIGGAIFLQLAIGGMVSTNYAGLACPDFPKCHDQWIPPLNFHLWLQVIHRLLGMIIVILALFLAIAGVRLLNAYEKHLRLNGSCQGGTLKRIGFVKCGLFLMPVMVAFQILLGVLNVFYFLPTSITVMHLANAVAIYTIVLTVAIYFFEPVFADDWKLVLTSRENMSVVPKHDSREPGLPREGAFEGSALGSLTHPSPQL
jgi:cytochrome c oxidase assembly protein subunit 15